MWVMRIHLQMTVQVIGPTDVSRSMEHPSIFFTRLLGCNFRLFSCSCGGRYGIVQLHIVQSRASMSNLAVFPGSG